MPTPRYEREIRSMLENMPEFLSDGKARRENRARKPPRRPLAAPSAAWTRDAYLMAALLTVLARFGAPALGPAGAHLIAWIAAALVVFAVVSSIVRAVRSPRQPPMWRGNVITYPNNSVTQRLTLWWRRFTSGGRRFG